MIINRFTCNSNNLPNIIRILNNKNMYPILDYINENGKNHYKNYKKIMHYINIYPNNYFSIKLSSLNIHKDIYLSRSYAIDICEHAINNNCKILIDAEDYKIQDIINNISNELMYKYNINNTHIYKTYQCYRKDSYNNIKKDIYDRETQNYNLGVKLVRGAYYNQDNKYNILYNNIEYTHNNYDNCIDLLFNKCNENDRIIIASHNNNSCNYALAKKYLLKNEDILSYAQLMGMNDELSNNLSENNKVFKYVPFGNLYESIPYLLRRLYENKDSIKYICK